MAATGKQKDGRRYTVDSSGISSLKREYLVVLDDMMEADGETLTFPGVPKIGSAHPVYPGLVVVSYDVDEGRGKDKKTLTVTANYSPRTFEVSDPTGKDPVTVQVDEWGWDDGTDEKELTMDKDGKPVVNSAGDPFDSVPTISVPAPTFTKVMKFKDRQSGWAAANCKVNKSEITIGGASFPAGTLLCSCAEKRIIGDEVWKYQYTVHLKYKSNVVKIFGKDTEIGWDAAVIDAGMRAKQTVGEGADAHEEIRIIRKVDRETGKMCVVTSAALLDGGGYAVSDTDPNGAVCLRFKAYDGADIPSWFYSEPTKKEEGLQ